MSNNDVLTELEKAVTDMDIPGVRKGCQDALAMGIPPLRAISDGLMKGMATIGQKFELGDLFITDLIVAGEAMQEGMRILEPHLEKSEIGGIGKVVLGTVEGDLHDIGKDVVAMLLKANGFEVVDLGVDVPADKFVETVRSQRPVILGMSALLTVTMPQMKKVIEALEKANLRKEVKVIVGGAPLSQKYADTIGADFYASDAVAGVNMCRQWVS